MLFAKLPVRVRLRDSRNRVTTSAGAFRVEHWRIGSLPPRPGRPNRVGRLQPRPGTAAPQGSTRVQQHRPRLQARRARELRCLPSNASSQAPRRPASSTRPSTMPGSLSGWPAPNRRTHKWVPDGPCAGIELRASAGRIHARVRVCFWPILQYGEWVLERVMQRFATGHLAVLVTTAPQRWLTRAELVRVLMWAAG